MLSTRNDNKKKRKRKTRIDGATPTIEEKDGCTMAVSTAPSLDMIDQLGYIPDILRQVMCVASLKDRDPLKPRGHGVMEDFFSKWDGMTGDMKACVSWKGVIKKYSKRVKSVDRAKSIKSPRFLINGKYISVYTIISKWFYIAPDYYEEAAGYRSSSSSSSGMEMQSQPTRDFNFLNEENTLLEDCCSDGKGTTPEEDPLVFFHTPHPDPASPSAPPSYYTATLPSNPPPPFMLPGNKKYQRFKFFNHETDEVVTFWVSKQMVMTEEEEEQLPNNNNNQDDVHSAAVAITTKRTTRAKYEIVDFQTRARKDIHIVEALVSASSCLDRHNHHSNNKNVGNEFRFICINPFHVMHHARNKEG